MARLFATGATRRGVIAREGDNEPDVDPVETAPAADSAESDMLEVKDSEDEGAAGEEAIDEAVDAAASLEQYKTALEAAAGNGGLDRSGAAVMNIGLESIYKRLGYSVTRPAVSLESFGQNSSRSGATTLALEDVKEKIKEIWEAIVKAIKRAIEWVKGHYDKVFGTAQNLQKRAKALQEKAKGINGQPKEKTFENDRIVKALVMGSSVPTTPSGELDTLKKFAEAVFGSISEFNAKTADVILTDLAKDGGDVAEIKAAGFDAGGAMQKVTDPAAIGFSAPGDGMSLFRSVALPGNKALLVEDIDAPASGEAAVTAMSKRTAHLGAFDPKAKEPSNKSVQTLAPAECAKIGAEVDGLMQEVINYKAKLSKASELKSKIASAAEKIGKSAATEEDKGKAAWFGAMQKMATNTVSNLDRAPASLASYSLNTAKAALDYAELSLKQYSTKA